MWDVIYSQGKRSDNFRKNSGVNSKNWTRLQFFLKLEIKIKLKNISRFYIAAYRAIRLKDS